VKPTLLPNSQSYKPPGEQGAPEEPRKGKTEATDQKPGFLPLYSASVAIFFVFLFGLLARGSRRLEILHLLMQNLPCSDEVMQSLETSFRFSNLRTPKSTFFGWAIL
jgi:hypothetical protein